MNVWLDSMAKDVDASIFNKFFSIFSHYFFSIKNEKYRKLRHKYWRETPGTTTKLKRDRRSGRIQKRRRSET